jgi:hypothetical protein
MRFAIFLLTMIPIFATSVAVNAQQRPSHTPAPPAAVPLQPPAPSAGKLRNHNHSPTRDNQQPAAENKHGTNEVPLLVKILPGPDHEAQAKEDQRRANEHAMAERGLVNATWNLAWFTLALVIVASGQIALFFWQLRLIRKSATDAETAAIAARDTAVALQSSLNIAREHADASRDAATAAVETTSIMKDTAQRQLRAYVSAKPITLKVSADPDNDIVFGVRFVFNLENHGASPARNVRNFCLPIIWRHPLIEERLPQPAESGITSSTTIFPRETFPSNSSEFNIKRTDLEEVFDGRNHRIYLFSVTRYNDIFGQSHETGVCVHCGGTAFKLAFERARDHAKTSGEGSGPFEFDYCQQGNYEC